MQPASARNALLERALSVGRWLAELPEVRRSGSGPTETYQYVRGDLGDYS